MDTIIINIGTPIISSAVISISGSIILLVKSLVNFSQTGPQVKNEILKHYSTYSIISLMRLTAWSIAIMFWLSLSGTLSYSAYCTLSGQHITFISSFIVAIVSILVFTGFQFSHALLFNPSLIVMSSHYRITRLIPYWKLLTVTRLRVIGLLLGIIFLMPIALLAGSRLNFGDTVNFLMLISILCMITAPIIYAAYPITLFVRKKNHQDQIQPNILLIGCDTLRADRVGKLRNGQSLTPFIDALAKTGVILKNCYTPIARTAPSLASLFTGTWPKTHGIRSNFSADSETQLKLKTLPQTLNESGYHTVALSDWAGSDFGKFSFGFNQVEVPPDQWNLKYLIRQGPKDIRLFLSLFCHNQFGKQFLPEIYYLGGIPLTKHLGKQTKRYLNTLSTKQQPFFLNVFMATTHPPFGSEYPYYTLFSDPSYAGESKFAMSRLTDPFEIIRQQQEPKEKFDLQQILALYDGSVKCFDDEVRNIMQHLDKLGLKDNTIVVLYSDHGMEFFEHNTWGQGNSAIADASSQVPMFITDPRQSWSGEYTPLSRTIDLMPTLLELCNIPTPSSVQGISLVPYLSNNTQSADLPVFFETGIWLTPLPDRHPEHLSYPNLLELLEVANVSSGTLSIKQKYQKITIDARDHSIRVGPWKLVRFPLNSKILYQLYHLLNDSNCQQNLVNDHPDIVKKLKCQLERYIGSLKNQPSNSDLKPQS